MVSFRVPLSMTTFHFFVLGKDAILADSLREFLQALDKKEVRAQAAEAISQLCCFHVGHPLSKLRSLGKHLHGGAFLDIATRAVLQQKHCCAYFHDLVSSFDDCSHLLFQHISASLFILEFYPWDEPVL